MTTVSDDRIIQAGRDLSSRGIRPTLGRVAYCCGVCTWKPTRKRPGETAPESSHGYNWNAAGGPKAWQAFDAQLKRLRSSGRLRLVKRHYEAIP